MQDTSTHHPLLKKVLWIALIFACAAHLSLPFFMKEKSVSFSPPSDPLEYRVLAYNLRHHHIFSLYTPEEGAFPQLLRTPLYPLFIAVIEYLTNDPLWIIIAHQLLLGTSAYLIFLVVKRKTNLAPLAAIASLLFLFEPLALFFSLQTWSETLFIFFLSLILYLTTRTKTSANFFVLGITWGLLILTRPNGILTLPLLSIPFLNQSVSKQTYKQLLSCGLGALLMVTPWLIRNERLTHTVTLSSSGLYNSVAGIYTQLAPTTIKPIRFQYEAKEDTLRHPEEPTTGLKSKLYTPDGLATLKKMAAAGREQISSVKFLQKQFLCQSGIWAGGWKGIVFEKYGGAHIQTIRDVADIAESIFYGFILLFACVALLSPTALTYAVPLWLVVGAVSLVNVCISSTRMRTSILPILLILCALGIQETRRRKKTSPSTPSSNDVQA